MPSPPPPSPLVLDGARVVVLLGLSALSGLIAAAHVLDALIAPAHTVAAVRRDVLLLALGAVLAWFAAFLLTGAILARLLGRRAGP
jgi:hypothetical protein